MRFAIPFEKLDDAFYSNRCRKSVIISGFIAIFIINIAILFSPTKGYELSIYDVTPSIIWLGLIVSSLCGIIIIVSEVYTKRCINSKGWVYGLIILLISRITLLFLPYNRGYVAWRGDHMSHIGSLHDILVSGSFAPDNFYPITHILLSELTLTTSLSTEFVTKYSTALFSSFFVLSIYLIGKFLINDKRVTLLALAATACVTLGYDVNLMPNGWSVLFFPFAIYIIIRATGNGFKNEYGILATIILILYPFFHPLSALLLVLLLSILMIMNKLIYGNAYIYSRFFQNIFPINKLNENNFSPTLVIIPLVAWVTWILSFRTFNLNIKNLFEALSSGSDANVLEGMAKTASKINLDMCDLINLVVKVEGNRIIFLTLFIFGSYIAYRKYKNTENFNIIFIFIIATLFFGFLYTCYLFNLLPGLGSINGGRILVYAIIFTPFFAGLVHMHLLSKKKVIFAVLCIGIMIVPVTLSIFGVFDSPYVNRPTPQVTSMDLHGMEWSFINKDRDIEYLTIMSPPYRFADSIFGISETKKRTDIRKYIENVPDHFNYPEMNNLGENYASDRYLVLTYFDKILYETVYKPVGRFNEPDFIRMKSDSSVHYLYNNGECGVYYITSLIK